jgi:hypothetical protein
MLILILPLALAASCTTPQSPSDLCAGWQPIDGQDASLDYLAAHDAGFLAAVVSHDEFGQHMGCWK